VPELQNVTLIRGQRTIFEALSLRLDAQRIGLIGDNGAGKSSLFRLLCGLDLPSQGSVRVAGVAAHALSRERPGLIGMMFQNPDEQIIFPTVEDELALSLTRGARVRKDALQAARQFLHARGLGDWCPRAVSSLSQGQRQHVCWLALLIAKPQLMLLDEPFASLDLPGQYALDAEVAKLDQQVMLSTHQLEHVRRFERVLWLEQGRVRADGPGSEVCAAYAADVAQRQSQSVAANAAPPVAAGDRD